MAVSTPHETFWLDLIYYSNAKAIQGKPCFFWNAFQMVLSKIDTSLERNHMARNLIKNHFGSWDTDQKNKMMFFLKRYPDLDYKHQERINFSHLYFERDVIFEGAVFNLDVNFSKTHFQEYVSFHRAVFNLDVNFSKTHFQEYVSFHRATFNRNVCFSETQFLYANDESFHMPSTDFSSAEFLGSAEFYNLGFSNIPDFSHVQFNDVKFQNVKFKKNTYFKETKFSGHAQFISTKFLSETTHSDFEDKCKEYSDSCAAYFDNATFSKQVLFQNIDIKGEANFKESKFKGLASAEYEGYFTAFFSKITFWHKADFSGSTFSSIVEFHNVKFIEDAIFSQAKFLNETNQYGFTTVFKDIDFKGKALFDLTKFKLQAHFSESDFKQLSNFYRAKFSEDVSFNEVNFKYQAYFSEANFCSAANFEKTTFHDFATFDDSLDSLRLNLKGATFKKHVPTTFGTKLHEDTSFLNVNWPIARKDTAEKHIHNYERLRIQAQGLGMIDSRNNFLRKELECRAVIAVGWDKLWRNAYGLISNHGTSVGRPLFCLLITFFCILTAWDAVYFPYLSDLVGSSTFWDIFGFNFSKVIPFTSMGSYQTDSFKTLIQEAPIFLIFLSSILSIISPILLFLAGLGLRSKFRMSL